MELGVANNVSGAKPLDNMDNMGGHTKAKNDTLPVIGGTAARKSKGFDLKKKMKAMFDEEECDLNRGPKTMNKTETLFCAFCWVTASFQALAHGELVV